MKGFLCITNAKNDAEYRAVVKRRIVCYIIAMIIGLAMAVVSRWAYTEGLTEMSDLSLGFFSGAGIGVIIACIIQIVTNIMLLKNEKKLHENRVASSDERLASIEAKARSISLTVLSFVLGGGCLIGGIFYPQLIFIFTAAVAIWAVSYVVAMLVYKNKM